MLVSLGLLFSFSIQAPAVPQTTAVETRIHPGRLLVRTDPRIQALQVDGLLRGIGARELWNLPQIGWRAIEVAPGTLHATKALLAGDAGFLEVEFDRARRSAHTPNDPFYGGMWHMPQIEADRAWDVEKGDPSVVVAIMDTGIEVAHPDLAANVWTNGGEIAGNLVDDDGNGYVDDVHGYDFHYGDPDPDDQIGHGTACAGIVAAVQDNALGVTGVAPHCRVAAVKAARDDGFFFDSAVVPALVYCADMGFEVISMSFFSDEVTPAEKDAIAYCWENGVLPVAAAGNASSVLPYYPAGYPETLAVGATIDATDARAFFTNFGSWVDVAAPGWALSTTDLFGGYTTSFGGTSGACPHVAGIAGLCFAAAPAATNAQVRAAIEDAAQLLEQFPYGKWAGYGRVDALAALERVLGIAQGSVPARFLFAAPCGGGVGKAEPAALPHARSRRPALFVAGVGLESPNQVRVLRDGEALDLVEQERQSVVGALPANVGAGAEIFLLRRNGAPVQSWVWAPSSRGWFYAATDASTPGSGALADGAFLELYRTDGVVFTCTEDTGSLITCEFAVRKVEHPDIREITLVFRRDYDGLFAGATELVEVYDWSSFSYPYGDWVPLRDAPAPTSFETFATPLPGDPRDYLDDEGTLYLRVTTGNARSIGLLSVDTLRLRVN